MNPTLLFLASLALLVGPLCGSLGARSASIREFVDGFALVAVAGLCLFIALPHIIEEIGFLGLELTALGVLVGAAGHRLRSETLTPSAFIAVALILHVYLEGAILSAESGSRFLSVAVLTHRLPVGFALVISFQSSGHRMRSVWIAGLCMTVMTIIGYLSGPIVSGWIPETGALALEAFVVGMFLHIVLLPHGLRHGHSHECGSEGDACSAHAHSDAHHAHHSHHDHHAHHGHHDHDAHHYHDAHHDHHDHHAHHSHHDHDAHHGHHDHHHADDGEVNTHGWSTIGALLGLFVVVTTSFMSPESDELIFPAFIETFGILLLESAPALLFGYFLAGIVPHLLTPSRSEALTQGGSFLQSFKGVVFGLPLPVCSCGVLPLYESLIRRGAPPAAALAFFVATPELGIDAALLSLPLLGTSLTVARLVCAFAVAMLVALLVGARMRKSATMSQDKPQQGSQGSWPERIRAGLRFGFVELFDHTIPWIVIGLVIAAVAEPLLSHDALQNIPPSIQVVLSALVGIPVYVCASGATPLAAIAIHKGLSAGAALAFLIAGPATNITTFGVLARLHGRKIAFWFGGVVTLLAILVGWSIDGLGIVGAPVLEASNFAEEQRSWFSWFCVGVLAMLMLASLRRQGPRGALHQLIEPVHSH